MVQKNQKQHDSSVAKWPKSNLEQVNLEGKLKGKWGQYESTELRILSNLLGSKTLEGESSARWFSRRPARPAPGAASAHTGQPLRLPVQLPRERQPGERAGHRAVLTPGS